MHTRQTHPVIGLIALAAYMLNLAAAAGGAVLCQEPAGESSIEFTCDHDHCSTSVETEHDHDAGGCWCSVCPCEDTLLAIDVAPLIRDDEIRTHTPDSLTFVFLQRSEIKKLTANRVLLAGHPPPALNRSLGQLRTVVLIV